MEAKEFRNKIKTLTPSIYDEIADLLATHGFDVVVTSIEVTSREDIDNKEDCIAAGGIWVCRDYNNPSKPTRCRCMRPPSTG